MELLNNSKYRAVFIISLIAILCVFTLWIRILPMFQVGNGDVLNWVGSDDPLYNLRQTEQMLVNFPDYSWFEVMTLFPFGTNVYWGPLTIYLCSVACLLAGATTRPEIISVALLVPPIMAVVMVPLMYLMGRAIADWKTGIFTAIMVATVSGQYFFRSFYGYLDHHMGEVLFSTLFCLLYIIALDKSKKSDFILSSTKTWKIPLIFSILAGIAYLLGHFTMPTMIIFAFLVGIFTLVQFIFDFHRGQDSAYLVFINTVIFLIASFGVALFGIKYQGFELSTYSLGHVVAFLFLIIGTWILFILSCFLRKKNKYLYPLTIFGISIFSFVVLFIVAPSLFSQFISNLGAFFGSAPVTTTIQEARGWGILEAWNTFSYGLILTVCGIFILLYRNFTDEHPNQMFVLIWSIIMLFATWQHVRYEYYLAVNIALLSAVCLGYAWNIGAYTTLRKFRDLFFRSSVQMPEINKKYEKSGKSGRMKNKQDTKVKTTKQPFSVKPIAIFFIVIILSILFIFTSLTHDYSISSTGLRMNQDWKETLEWMDGNTPSTGVDYFKIYKEDSFTYPPTAYGVMSWWDYGHMITYIAKRIPNANPFQRGVAGPIGAATYFLLPSEEDANEILDTLKTKYVITDIEMDLLPDGKFWAMATWYNSTAGTNPYLKVYAMPNPQEPSVYSQVAGIEQTYYTTMVSRLHNFDGSMVVPSMLYYIEYSDATFGSTTVPVISNIELLNYSEVKIKVNEFNAHAVKGYHAGTLNPTVFFPKETVPALKHYRLVHESPTNVIQEGTLDIKYVKTFEYVKGAHIKGSGIIEVPIVTNTGRTFVYRQESENGEFIVPYSTTGGPDDVRATGKYHIAGTNQYFDVPETAVTEGKSIS